MAQSPSCTQLSSPSDSDYEVSPTAVIQWNAVATATYYLLFLGTTPGGTEVLDNFRIDDQLIFRPPSGLLANTTYFITILPGNNSGNATNCAEETFTTGDSSGIPGCVTLLSPLNGATGVSPDTNIRWAEQAEATGYMLSIGTSVGGNEILDTTDVGNTTAYDIPLPLPVFIQVYISLIPYNDNGDMPICESQSFRTRGNDPPQCTEIINPSDGDQFVSVTANITWIRDFSASGYLMTIEEKSRGGVKILDSLDVGNGTNYKPPDFLGNTLYFVTIAPYNDLGPATGCQPISFTTGAAPQPPACTVLIEPKDGSRDVSVNTGLRWMPVPNALGYLLSVGTAPDTNDIADNVDIINATTYDFEAPLPSEAMIYVSVTPYTDNWQGEGCPREAFITIAAEAFSKDNPIPPFFTPNNDGINDIWLVPPAAEGLIVSIHIFNRFGQLLKDLEANQGWDGNFNGRPMASGSYWYLVELNTGLTLRGYFALNR